jgi:hypothetical protein
VVEAVTEPVVADAVVLGPDVEVVVSVTVSVMALDDVAVGVTVCTVVKIDSVHVRPPNEGAHAHSNVKSISLLARSSGSPEPKSIGPKSPMATPVTAPDPCRLAQS